MAECIYEFNSVFARKCKGRCKKEQRAEHNEPPLPPCPKASQSTEEEVSLESAAGGRLHLQNDNEYPTLRHHNRGLQTCILGQNSIAHSFQYSTYAENVLITRVSCAFLVCGKESTTTLSSFFQLQDHRVRQQLANMVHLIPSLCNECMFARC